MQQDLPAYFSVCLNEHGYVIEQLYNQLLSSLQMRWVCRSREDVKVAGPDKPKVDLKARLAERAAAKQVCLSVCVTSDILPVNIIEGLEASRVCKLIWEPMVQQGQLYVKPWTRP